MSVVVERGTSADFPAGAQTHTRIIDLEVSAHLCLHVEAALIVDDDRLIDVLGQNVLLAVVKHNLADPGSAAGRDHQRKGNEPVEYLLSRPSPPASGMDDADGFGSPCKSQ